MKLSLGDGGAQEAVECFYEMREYSLLESGGWGVKPLLSASSSLESEAVRMFGH